MSNYYGTDTYSIDDKGRLAVPAQARRAAGKNATFLLVPGFEGCLALYSEAQWAVVEERLRLLPGKRVDRAFKRALLMNAKRVTVDAQGRIPIPPSLMRRAGLGKEAVLHGADDHIEIWNPDRFKAAIAPVTNVDGEYERLASELFKDDNS